MKIYKNVLPIDLLDDVKKEVTEMLKQNVWASSQLRWDRNLLIGITGDCGMAIIPTETSNRLADVLKSYLPSCDSLTFQYFAWKSNGGIALHSDNNKKFGATIYLNKEWDKNFGGIFLWEENGELKGLSPEHNTMVLNDEKQPHMVTPVSPLVPNFRFTIQIWGN